MLERRGMKKRNEGDRTGQDGLFGQWTREEDRMKKIGAK